jgi:hypothetical protein
LLGLLKKKRFLSIVSKSIKERAVDITETFVYHIVIKPFNMTYTLEKKINEVPIIDVSAN